ncbi:24403_t:CDS:2, partial [Gigaspora rosea]
IVYDNNYARICCASDQRLLSAQISVRVRVKMKDRNHPGGHPDGPVWNYFTKGEKLGKGRNKATCNFCGASWNRGEPNKLENSTTIRYFLSKILSDNSKKNKSNKKRKSNIHGKLDQYVSVIELDQQKVKRIHLAWARAFAIYLGFKNRQFSRIIKIVGSIWQKFEKDHASWNILVAQLRLYKEKKYPYNQPYAQGYDILITWWNSIEPEPKYLQELVLKILAIVPNSVLCERNFSLLTWLTGNKRIQIDIQNLETIAKLCTYYNSNAKKELSYFANEMTENEVLEILNQTNIKTFEEKLEKEGLNKDELLLFNNLDFGETYTMTREILVLFLEENLDLNDEIFVDDLEKFPDIEDNDEDLLLETDEILENINKQTNQILGQDDYNWNPEDNLNSDVIKDKYLNKY